MRPLPPAGTLAAMNPQSHRPGRAAAVITAAAVLAVLWLEVQHPARPWHTAVLGALLMAYLLTVHLDESGATPRTFRRQAPLLAVDGWNVTVNAASASHSPVRVTPNTDALNVGPNATPLVTGLPN